MKNYEITITEKDIGLLLETELDGTKYGQHYRHKDTEKALADFEALIRKYLTQGDLAVMGGY
jgi:hypothetical protein